MGCEFNLAEGEGFEPSVRCRTLVFKTSTLSHSVNLPSDIVTYLANLGGGVVIRRNCLRIVCR